METLEIGRTDIYIYMYIMYDMYIHIVYVS